MVFFRRRFMRGVSAGLIALTLFLVPGALPSRAADESEFARLDAAVMRDFYRGDYDSIYGHVTRIVSEFPDRPEAYLSYFDIRRLASVYGYENAGKTLRGAIDTLRGKADFEGKNSLLLALSIELESLLDAARLPGVDEVSARLYPVRRWKLMGPFNRFGPGDIDQPFLPELSPNSDSAALKARAVTLRDARGFLDCGKYLYPPNGVAYALTTIRIPRPVKIRVYSEATYALFVNGRKVIQNSRQGVFRKWRVVRLWGTDAVTLMLKLYRGDSWRCRVIVTDENDVPLQFEETDFSIATGSFQYAEEMDHPYGYFVRQSVEEPDRGLLHLGNYYDELDSPESLKYYRMAAERTADPVHRYFYAAGLIEYAGEDRSSARYLEGWRVLQSMASAHPDFVPLRHKMFSKYIEARDYRKAGDYGRGIRERARRYYPFRRDFVALMDALGFDREFDDEIESMKRDFPASLFPMERMFRRLAVKNPQKAVPLGKELLRKNRSPKTLSRLVRLLRDRGDYDEALRCLDEFGRKDTLSRQRIDILIDKNDFESAKKELIRALAEREDPSFLLRLGEIGNGEAGQNMYWQRLLFIRPSHFALSEFMEFLQKGRLGGPLEEYRDRTIDPSKIAADRISKPADGGADILHRGRLFILNSDGGSRVFCEDLVYLKDQKLVEKWGEYKVPFRGDFNPVTIRVYLPEGGHSDVYSMQNIDGTRYLTLSSVKKGSVLHLSYIVDFPVTDPRQSQFFSLPPTTIQRYGESVAHFSLGVVAPKGMKVNFLAHPETAIREQEMEDRVLYSMETGPRKAVNREGYMGNRLNYLPWFAFSTMSDMREFVCWYNGLLRGTSRIDPEFCRARFAGGDTDTTLKKVYEYVARDVDLRSRLLYYPGVAEDTSYIKRGTAEDKTVLAKAILENLGIASFLALARPADFPATGEFVSPHIFTDVLLFVPLSRDRGMWMDFADEHLECGAVRETIEGRTATVIVGDGYEHKSIDTSSAGETRGEFTVVLDEHGGTKFDIRLDYTGRRAALRRYFQGASNREMVINRYFGAMIPGLDIDEYEVKNSDEYNRPFELRIKGEGFALATPARNRMILQPVLNKSDVYNYIRYDRRTHPLFIRDELRESERYLYRLPEGYGLAGESREYSLTTKFGSFRVAYGEDGKGNLSVEKKITINRMKIDPADYGDFVSFCIALKNAEYRNVMIKKKDHRK